MMTSGPLARMRRAPTVDSAAYPWDDAPAFAPEPQSHRRNPNSPAPIIHRNSDQNSGMLLSICTAGNEWTGFVMLGNESDAMFE